MSEPLHLLLNLDDDAIRATTELRWAPLTVVLSILSAWWVKGPLLVGAAWSADIRCRRAFPLVGLAAAVSFFVASGLNALIKGLIDRSRPPAAIDLHALISVPGSPSFPSGHAMTAFAVAGAVAVLAPRLRVPVLALAALIAFSRVYLGVHFWLDVLVGAALGLAIGWAVARTFRSWAAAVARQARAGSGAGMAAAG